MPLNATILKDLIITKLDAASFVEDPANRNEALRNVEDTQDKAVEAIASALIEHIQANALVIGGCPSGGGPLVNGKIL